MRRIPSGLGLLGPVALVALCALAFFVATVVVGARQVDASVRRHEEDILRRGVAARIVEVEKAIFPETNWDDAVRNVDLKFNTAWADDNLTGYFAQAANFRDVYVLNDQDEPIYARRGGKEAPLAAFAELAPVRGVVADVRRRELARGAFPPPPGGKSPVMLSKSIQSSQFLIVGGRPLLVTATLIQPDFGTVLPKPRAAVVVTTLPFDKAEAAMLRDRFQLSGLTLQLGESGLRRGSGHVSVATAAGGPPLVISWTPQTPGAQLLSRAAIPMAVVVAALIAIGSVMIARARRAAAQLIASTRTQNEFLANMSHEIRTPLNGVLALAGALERTPLSPTQGEMVGIISSSAGTLQRLLGDLLDVSRMEAGAVRIEHAPFHLAAAVRDVAALAKARADEKGLDLRIDLDPALDVEVEGDMVRVKQVLTNLVSNAVKFTDTGYVALGGRYDATADRFVFTVSDTGIGFDAAVAEKIFERFQQADGSVTRKYGGTGLGLAISSQLAHLMRGNLEALSEPGCGSIFTFTVPLTRSTVRTAEPEAAPVEATAETEEPAGRPLRVLVADDHPTNLRVVQVLLDGFDVDLVCAVNGQEACEAFESGDFDLVLMDMQMPVMDGLTAIRRIRAREGASRRTPIYMLTANALPEHQAASKAAGADRHITKPIQAAQLFAALQEVAEMQQAA